MKTVLLILCLLVSCGVALSATITVTSPNGGEVWIAGSTHAVTWTSSGVTGNVRIDFAKAYNNQEWDTVSTAVAASAGTFTWTVPYVEEVNSGRVRVRSRTDWTVQDVSDTNFSIQVNKIHIIQGTDADIPQRFLIYALAPCSLLFSIKHGTLAPPLLSVVSDTTGIAGTTVATTYLRGRGIELTTSANDTVTARRTMGTPMHTMDIVTSSGSVDSAALALGSYYNFNTDTTFPSKCYSYLAIFTLTDSENVTFKLHEDGGK